jgi:hypothetical protein
MRRAAGTTSSPLLAESEHFSARIAFEPSTMTERPPVSRFVLVAAPALVLFGYGCVIVMNYWPYFNAQLQLRSHDLAGLPEDVVGFGFWMCWPLIALLFALALISALAVIGHRVRAASILVSTFTVLSVVDYYLYERLVEALLRG